MCQRLERTILSPVKYGQTLNLETFEGQVCWVDKEGESCYFLVNFVMTLHKICVISEAQRTHLSMDWAMIMMKITLSTCPKEHGRVTKLLRNWICSDSDRRIVISMEDSSKTKFHKKSQHGYKEKNIEKRSHNQWELTEGMRLTGTQVGTRSGNFMWWAKS